jgi:tryptophan halogenase
MILKNKTIIIMGGGTAGWVSALYFLNKSKDLNLNLNVKIITSSNIEPIGVGEGTLTSFPQFIEKKCKIDKREFLRETKGSFKYGIKFDNWNFDNEYYYHLFSPSISYESPNKDLDWDFVQYIINEDLNIPNKTLQKKLAGCSFELLENNKISLKVNDSYAYHFSANLIIPFFKKKCLEFAEFEYIEGMISDIKYDQKGFINKILTEENKEISGDFFVNCLGFGSQSILNKEYFDIENWDNYILNNSAFAIQVKNSSKETIEPYTTATAQNYGWSWKIPQYEKTGYGYVYSNHFVNDENKLYDDLLKKYKIKEKDIFKTKIVKSKPYLNKKQLFKNCLSLGLASGFVEPLEATSIHMTLIGLDIFFELIENNIEIGERCVDIFNLKLKKLWENVFKFIIYHYFINNPPNDYWKYYKNIQDNNIFDFYEKYYVDNNNTFSRFSYYSVSLGMRMKDFYYSFSQEKYLKENIYNYLKFNTTIDHTFFYSHNEILNQINKNQNLLNY